MQRVMHHLPVYGVLLLTNILPLLLSILLSPLVGPAPSLWFVAAIALSVWVGGSIGGLFSVLFASLASEYFLIPPLRSISFGVEDLSWLGLYILVSVLFYIVIAAHRQAAGRLDELGEIVASSDDAILTKTLQGVIMSWNAAAERMYGYQAEEVIGKSILVIVPPDKQEELQEILKRIQRGERVNHFETVRLRKDGQPIDVSLTISPVRDKAGRLRGASAIGRNITERKRAEEALTRLSSALEQTADNVLITDREGVIEYVNPAFERVTGYPAQEAIGKTPRLLKSGKHDEEFYENLWSTILSGEAFRGQLINRRKNGELYFEEKTITPIRDRQGNITHFVSTGKDITDRVQAYQTLERRVEERTRETVQLFSQAEQRRRELEALYRADEQLHRHLRLDQVLQTLVDVVIDILHADKSSVQVWDPERKRLVVRAARGYSSEMLQIMSSYEPGDGIAGNVFLSGEPIAVEDARYAPPPADHIAEIEGIRSVLSVPIKIDGQIFGVFGMDYSQPRSFSADDKRLFLALAQRAAIAIENARLYEQAEQAAILEERQRLARDLHDSVTQSLYSLMLLAEAGRRLASSGDLQHAGQHLTRLGETAQQALREMRLLVYELRPLALQKAGLVGALQQRLDAVEKRAGIQARLKAESQLELSPMQEEELFRIAQEALNNSLKHSSATAINVNLRVEGEYVVLEVVDNGKGFDPDLVGEQGGLGMSSMRERAERLGAHLTMDAAASRGTVVTVRIKKPANLPASGSQREGFLNELSKR